MKTGILKLGGLVLSVSLLASCGQRNSSSEIDGMIAGNIVGGTNMTAVQQKEAGVVGLVIVKEDGIGTCTGSLIAKRIVLTAAHCIDSSDGPIKQVFVVFTHDMELVSNENVRGAITGRSHEAFMPSLANSWNDIALLKLNEDAPADFKLARLPSATTDADLKAGVNLTQMGFGRTVADKSAADTGSGVLKSVDGIAILKKSAAGKELHLNEDKKGSCNGDSGGPAFMKDASGVSVQVGLNSRGTLTNSCIGVGIYTNVAAHLDWIKSTSAELMAVSHSAPVETPAAQEPVPEPQPEQTPVPKPEDQQPGPVVPGVDNSI